MDITRYKQSSFLLDFKEKGIHVYFDPFMLPKDAPKADYILISHPHFDHYHKKSIKRILKESTVIICPKSVQKIVKKLNAIGMDVGTQLELDSIIVDSFPMLNLRLPLHTNKKKWLGYVISIDDKRIYHAGDTEVMNFMKEIKNIDIAFLPIGGIFTMNIENACKAAEIIKPKVIIPMHERGKDIFEFKKIIENKFGEIKVYTMKPNEKVSFL